LTLFALTSRSMPHPLPWTHRPIQQYPS